MAPGAGYYLTPWKRSPTACCYVGDGGGNKFDLDQWDDAYFARLKDYLQRASDSGIVINFGLFGVYYGNLFLQQSPLYWKNNVNDIEHVEDDNTFYFLNNPKALNYETAFLHKILTELNSFDNIYYEIINEPYEGKVSDDWQNEIAEIIASFEKTLPNQHLIARNIANFNGKITNCCNNVSIYNFHYASPDAVLQNYGVDRVISYDESGFQGGADEPYRRGAWLFILAGGAVFDNLDYSFYVGYENGTGTPPAQFGGGSPQLRAEIVILKDFMFGLDFINMKGDPTVVGNIQPPNTNLQYSALVHNLGEMYAIYLGNSTAGNSIKFDLNIKTNYVYDVTWLNPVTGEKKSGGMWSTGPIVTPLFNPDVALLLKKH